MKCYASEYIHWFCKRRSSCVVLVTSFCLLLILYLSYYLVPTTFIRCRTVYTLNDSEYLRYSNKISWIYEQAVLNLTSDTNVQCPQRMYGNVFTNEYQPLLTLEHRNLNNLNIQSGGIWSPSTCRSINEPIALITPIRNRLQTLQYFIKSMHSFLQYQSQPYIIIVVNQTGNKLFNRGLLFNVGVLLSPLSVNCFVLSDVDMIPLKYENQYICNPEYPKHISSAISKWNYKIPYNTYFGGITAFNREQYFEINGYSSQFWGWGGEDDDAYRRAQNTFMKIDRVSAMVGRIFHFHHFKNESAPVNSERRKLLEVVDSNNDGLSTTVKSCKILSVNMHSFYTEIKVDCQPL
ncbi:hypothetical protein GJ496_010573 [Pomphorhynchus laevis]|nr:hypothetical protein GJ496_010573 [Pomphorhynchus laevis]